MVNAARASAPLATAPPSPNQSLVCPNFAPTSHPTNHDSRVTYHASLFTNCQSLLTNHAFLIASRQLLEIELTHSQQTRKYFLIASFSAISAFAPQLNDGRREFLIATDQTEKIANHMKLNEKRFSNRNKLVLRDITDLPVSPGS
jgi:hypothetical protein